MKKITPVIVLAALCAAALIAFVCTDVKFDNPLDEKGTNFLYKDTSFLNNKDSVLKTNDNGTADLFSSPKYQCDKVAPIVTLVGSKEVSINTSESNRFRELVGNEGNIMFNVGTPKTPELTDGTGKRVEYPSGGMPGKGTGYVITYIVEKDPCPDGVTPRGTAERILNITEYNCSPTDSAVVWLEPGGQATHSFEVNTPYRDPGVRAYYNNRSCGGGEEVPLPLDSIVVKDGGAVIQRLVTSPVNASGVDVPNTVAKSYTVTYYTHAPGGRLASATRTVTVTPKYDEGPIVTVVLKSYKHSIGGKTIEHPDTSVFIGGTYREIGVESVYFMSGGNKVTLNDSVVAIVSSPSTTSAGQKSASYMVQGGTAPNGANYRGVTISRYVYVAFPRNDCDGGDIPPTVTTTGTGNLSLSISGDKWEEKWKTGFTATGNDGYTAWQYIVDRGTLDPGNLTPGSTHNVTYVGLGRCGGTTATANGTVTVVP
ncbi:MAG: hypothetical protein LBH93_08990 [Chitinispirillales bacterium]|jgi:hypothetical protein|nr:hypothetical protein [Chitinispirillales bacterium]